jgi:hypothetical protein
MGKAGFGYSHTVQNVTFNFNATTYANHDENGHTQNKRNYNHGRHRLRDGGLIPSCAAAAIGGEAAVEAGLEMGNGEEEDRPGLDARTRLPPVLQAPRTPTSVRVVGRRRRIRAIHPACAHRHHHTLPRLRCHRRRRSELFSSWSSVTGLGFVVGGGGSRKGMGRRRWDGEKERD